MPQPLRIGEIGYANLTPIFQTLRSMVSPGPFRFIRGTPARLNALLAEGKIDLGPVSSIEYARDPKSYWILPQLSISAIGTVESILLFARRPLGDLKGATIGCTSASATSHALLTILFNRFYKLGVECASAGVSLSEMLKTHPAALLIGDEALKAARRERRGLFVYDLGRLWHDYTGLPFVFALWLVRRDLDPGRLSMARDLWSDLVLAKETAYRSFERLAASASERKWMGEEGLVRYWRTISYDLTPAHLAGLSRFYREARALGLVPGVPAPVFLPGTFRGANGDIRRRGKHYIIRRFPFPRMINRFGAGARGGSMFRLIAFVLVSLFVAAKAFAADPPPAPSRPALTLDRCVETALANNHLIRAARADVGAKEGLVIQARSPLLPQITGSVARSESESEGVTGKTTTEATSSSLSASQLLYDFGKTYGSLGAAKANLQAGKGGLEKVIQDVVLSVKQAFYAHIIAKRFVSVQEAVLTSAQAHLKQAAAFYEVGVRPRYDVTQAEVEVNNALLGLSTARNNVRLTRISLNNAMGIDPNAPAEIEETLADKKEMPPLDESAREALANRPEVRQADAQVEAALQALRAAQGKYWPTISASGSYTWNDGTTDSARFGGKSDLGNSWSAQVGLTFPLFEGFAAHGKVREAEANLDAAHANRENLKQGVLLDVNQAHANLDDARVRVTLTESNLKKARENMDLAKGRYEAGVGAIIEVTDANTSLVKAETDALQALGDLQLAIARLERAMGRR